MYSLNLKHKIFSYP